MWDLNCGTNEPIYKTETDSHTEVKPVFATGAGERRGTDWLQALHLRWIGHKSYWTAQGTVFNIP